MCSTATPAELALMLALLVLLPYVALPLGAAVAAWRQPSRGRVLLAVLACLPGAAWAAYALATSDPSVAADGSAYRFRVAVASVMPYLLVAAAASWAVAFGTRRRGARVVGLALAAVAAAAGLALAVSFAFPSPCPGGALPPAEAAALVFFPAVTSRGRAAPRTGAARRT